MPAPLDLLGRRFGHLAVIARATGKAKGGLWLCRCDCGAEEVFPAHRLPYADYVLQHRRDVATACSTCMHTRTCEECGSRFVSVQPRATCSEACRIARLRATGLRSYRKRAAADPEFNRGRYRARVDRLAQDEERLRLFYARAREAKRRSRERRNADPDKRVAHLEWHRAHYAAHAAGILARRRTRLAERLARMTTEEREARADRLRELSRNWWAARRALLRQSPEAYRAYLDRMGGYSREYDRRKALANLLETAAELDKRSRTE